MAPDDPTILPAPPTAGAAPADAATVIHQPTRSTRTPDSLFPPGAVIAGRYRIIACLGKGGMGEVYRADDLSLGQPVALKFLPEALGYSAKWMERFRNEVRVARQVAHPHVCRVHDLAEVPAPHGAGALNYLTMEYIDGEDLASLLRRIGRLPHDKAVQVAHQLCAGLAAAHTAGVLHRDLKPGNIMIDGRGNAKITDFGIAGLAGQIEGADVRSGTPAYMSLEQLAGREVSVRSDIYSLGLVLYELFTGRQAFSGGTATSATASRTETELSRPSTLVKDIDPAIERVIMRCLSEEPGQRPPSALAVAAGLPGGDPLRAALEAGETPSPELVAAAGSDDLLRLRVAVPLLLVALLSVIGANVVGRWTNLISHIPTPRAPDALLDRARGALEILAPQLAIDDTASSLLLENQPLLAMARDTDDPQRWDRLRTGRPPVLRYWLRTSPRQLVALNMERSVAFNDPPFDTPGMTRVELDSLGRLIRFQAVPPWPRKDAVTDVATPKGEPGDTAAALAPLLAARTGLDSTTPNPLPPDPDWKAAFALAGLDHASFAAAEPKRLPAHFADTRRAWTGVDPAAPHVPLRIEADAYEGRITGFRVLDNRGTGDDVIERLSPTGKYLLYVLQGLFYTAIAACAWLARRNFLTGRGDRAGALRLGSGFFVLGFVSWALATHYMSDMQGQSTAVFMGVATGLLYSGLAWVFYMALEPLIRRHSPELIVSWTRLLAGRIRDPLVGRDILIGFAAGALFIFAHRALPLLHESITGGALAPQYFDVGVLSGVLDTTRLLCMTIIQATYNSMLIFFLFFIAATVLARFRLGMFLFIVLATLASVRDPAGTSLPVVIAFALLTAVALAVGLHRLGLLPFLVCLLVVNAIGNAPPLQQLGDWTSRGPGILLAVLALLLVWGFIQATGLQRRPHMKLVNSPS